MNNTLNDIELLYTECVKDIKSLFESDRYISKKDYQKIIDQYKEIFDNIHQFDYDNSKKESLIKLSNEIDNYISKHNEKFINQKLVEYKDYFDTIFKDIDPEIVLDEEQRKAILIDEDYSLVIAGAGSGKTTTMTAKVKYLIEKCHIAPSEIAILSFTKKAVEELDNRINNDFKLNIKVKTFHKLGLEILNDRLNYSVRAIEESGKRKIISEYFKQRIFPSRAKLSFVMDIFSKYLFLDPECLKFGTFDEYWSYYTKKKYIEEKDRLNEYNDFEVNKRLSINRSIQNEFLRSKHETTIANFLYTNNIQYKYEQKYTESENRINYNPDFTVYTPNGKVYIEFYGLSKYFQYGHYSKEEILAYNNLERKKKELHQRYGTDLIELYPDDDLSTTNYLKTLKEELEKRNIFCNQRSNKEIFLKLMETNKDSQIYKFIELIIQFISKFKSNSYTDEDFITLEKNTEHTIVKQQLGIIREIYHYYNNYIHNQYLVDFEDMINYAYRYMSETPIKNSELNYKYVIVDEYQDISYQRFNLLQKISDVFDAKIIGVGDDWQAIFGFSGADIKLFTDFCELMGYGEIIKITNTYRNSQELIDVAGEFVLKNSNQFEKHLQSPKHLKNPIEIIYYNHKEKLSISETLEALLEQLYKENSKQSILLLGRYNNDIERILKNSKFKEGIKSNNEIKYTPHRDMNIKFLTVHSAKGLGFDQVILINALDGTYGFPSKMKDDEIISILNSDFEENIAYAEERRLFYVAITRTKNKLFILAPKHKISTFITEIREYDNVIEKDINTKQAKKSELEVI